MNYLLYSDVHFCENSCSIQSRGQKYSTRLEYLIRSINWAEEQAIINNCDAVICLGDFFDRSDIKSEEATALQEINWVNLPHYFIVGNHEASNKSLTFNSVEVLRKINNFNIISEPTSLNNEILLLPYIKESELKSLKEYWTTAGLNLDENKKIVLSHNSIKGIQMGPFISKEGLDIDEIDNFCTKFINGHLHNGTQFSKKGVNIGNLSGQNFGEDATKYSHNAYVFNDEDCTLKVLENPFAFNFYKVEIINENDIEEKLKNLKKNAVLSIKCAENLVNKVKELLMDKKDIIASRIIIIRNVANLVGGEDNNLNDLIDTTNHLHKFITFAQENIEKSDILHYELSEICKNEVA